jgi:protoheme ferro-lyase
MAFLGFNKKDKDRKEAKKRIAKEVVNRFHDRDLSIQAMDDEIRKVVKEKGYVF